MMTLYVNLGDIDKGEIKGLLSELLFNEGICVKEYHAEYFFDNCTHGVNYKVMYEKDIEIMFEEGDDEDYPIGIYYSTIFDTQFLHLEYISMRLFNTLEIKKKNGGLING